MPSSSARETIRITTPYFLPDRSARAALVDAVRKRGVQVQILTAGPKIDHPFIRRLSLPSSRHLLDAGAEIYDYQPAMIHAKLMTVDGQWSVVGSTNFDHRSFALNDEVNLAVAQTPPSPPPSTLTWTEDLRAKPATSHSPRSSSQSCSAASHMPCCTLSTGAADPTLPAPATAQALKRHLSCLQRRPCDSAQIRAPGGEVTSI